MTEYIAQYGYAALFVGTFLEGETILLLAGIAASQGLLSLPLLVTTAMAGTLFGDQLFFYLGRHQADWVLQRRPSWQPAIVKVQQLWQRYPKSVLLGYRFLYGLRNVTPFLLGASKLHPAQFLLWNLLSSLLWACGVALLGFYGGQWLETKWVSIEHGVFMVLVVGFLSWSGYRWYRLRGR